jgi:ATP phosphoribosyltransferase
MSDQQQTAKKVKLDNATNEDDYMLFAIPKKGRLYEKCVKLLEGSGLRYTRNDRLDIAYCSNLPVAIVFLPAADIAQYVANGNVELGITGLDIVEESEVDVEILENLGFGKCKLAVQAPVGKFSSAADIAGMRVHTSFPNRTKKYFSEVAPSKVTQVTYLNGSVEIACSLGLADAVVDLVETGTTMKAAGLEIVSTIMETQAVLIHKQCKSTHQELCRKIHTRIQGYITAQEYQMVTYNIERSKIKLAELITPGKRSPTVSPLEDSAWCAVSALVKVFLSLSLCFCGFSLHMYIYIDIFVLVEKGSNRCDG